MSTVARGRRAEAAVVDWLRARGARIVGTNVRSGRYEIDVIARDGPLVMIVEVRMRGPGAWAKALESVDARKRARIVAAARSLWRTRLSKMEGVERVRFDVAAVRLDGDAAEVEYVAGAFTA